MLEELMETEKEKRSKSVENNLIKANINLMDKINLLKEDIQNEIYKIRTSKLTKSEVVKDLEKILENNN